MSIGSIKKAVHAKEKLFDSTRVLCTRTTEGAWVSYGAIVDMIGYQAALSSLSGMRVSILVELDGREFMHDFVSRADFYGAAIISKKCPKFREFVVSALEELEDRGFVGVSRHTDNLHVLQARNTLDLAIKVADLECEVRETTQRQSSLEQEHKALEGRVDEIADATVDWRYFKCAMDGLKARGITITGREERKKVGLQVAAIGRNLGYPVDEYRNGTKSNLPNVEIYGHFPKIYPIEPLERILDVWVRTYHKKSSSLTQPSLF